MTKVRTHLMDALREYREAVRSFSGNANKYLLAALLQGVGGAMLGTVFGIYVKAAGLPTTVVGNIEGAVALSAAVVCLVAPPLVSFAGYRTIMTTAMALMVAARLGQAAVPDAVILVAAGATVGAGDGLMRALNSAFLSENSSGRERSHLFSIDFVLRLGAAFVGGLAGGFAPGLLQRFMAEIPSYQWTIAAAAVLTATGVVPMLAVREHKRNPGSAGRAYVRSLTGFRSWKLVGKLIAPQFTVALAGGMVLPFVPIYLKNTLGASMRQVGLVQSLSSVFVGLAVFGTPWVAKKLGLGRGVATLQMLSLPFLMAIPFTRSLPLAASLLFARGAIQNMSGPMYNQLSMEHAPAKDKPLIAGWTFFGLNIAWFIGATLGGHLMTADVATPFVLGGALFAVSPVLTYLVWHRWHEPAQAEVGGASDAGVATCG